ncbi:MAG: hypothetical protein JWO84_74 [Parcubacteria group bacterium]|nr:hypothetical protein [Parcubacteria group bacterium]
MRLNLLAGIAVGTVLAASAMGAQAATHLLFNYSSTNLAAPFTAFLDFTLGDTPVVGLDGFAMVAVTGNVDGDSITGLVNNPNSPGVTTAFNFNYDNIGWLGPNFVSNNGALVKGASTNIYNFFSQLPATTTVINGTAGSGYQIYKATSDGSVYLANSVGNASVSVAVPEPATWALMLVGFGGLGAALRANRKRTLVPT